MRPDTVEVPIRSSAMRSRLDPANMEVLYEQMTALLRTKTPADRIAMIGAAHRTAKHLMAAGVRILHPDWDENQVRSEMLRRLLHGTSGPPPIGS